MKDETKTSDMIDIMEEYYKYLPTSETGKPVKLPLYCDGLSCERADGAQKARTNGEDEWQCLLGLEPCAQDWHKRQLLLQDTYDKLFKIDSQRLAGTLYHSKQYFGYKDVSGNIFTCFNSASDLLHFSTEGHVCAYVQQYISEGKYKVSEMSTVDKSNLLHDACASLITFIYEEVKVQNILHVRTVGGKSKAYKLCLCKYDHAGEGMVYCENTNCPNGQWFHYECVGLQEEDIPDGDYFCSTYCEQVHKIKNDIARGVENTGNDSRSEYARVLMWRGLNDMIREDGTKENYGSRIIRHWKLDLLDFEMDHHPKYITYGPKLLLNVNGAASPRPAHQIKWNRTTNSNGGVRKNVSKDLHNEHINRKYKQNSKVSLGQLTDATIKRHSQLIGIETEFDKLYEEKVIQTVYKLIHK